MKRLIILAALLAFVMFESLAAQSTLRRTFRDLDIDVWTDHDDGANYFEGDDVTIYFRASEDAYVLIYDLDSRGNVNLIFPADPDDNNLVRADEVYQIPEGGDDYELTVEGPPGTEYIQMVASPDYFPIPDWRGPVSVYDKNWGFKYEGDNDEFVENINNKHFPGDGFSSDQVSFYVAPKYYYKPVKADCSGNCGTVYVDYPDGCEVYVDGVFFGYAPLYVPSIYLGRHRMTVYWGASVVYNDWIFVDLYDPFFVWPRQHYLYRYCYDRWYHNYVWDSYYGRPSHYKYKRGDFYTYSKPTARRGYEVIGNEHSKYKKSNTYVAEKVSRITKYKQDYGFDAKSKTYTTTKYRVAEGAASKKYYDGKGYDRGKGSVKDGKTYYEPKSKGGSVTKGGSTEGKKGTYYEPKKPVDAGSKGKGGYYEPKKPVDSGNKGKSNGGYVVPKKGDDSGDKSKKEPANNPKSGGSDNKSKSDGGGSKVSAPPAKQDSGNSGGKPSSSGGSSGKKHK